MKIFISHAEKNKEVVLEFAKLLEMLNSEIQVFCSSEEGSIKVGENFIKTIFEELNSSDIFVPIISSEYYASKFCMIELGVAYSYLLHKYEKNGEEYIFPFALYPVRKGHALSRTPLSNIQTGELDNENDIREFLNLLALKKGLSIGSGINRKLHAFKEKINEILLQKQNIIDMAKINTYFDDNVNYKQKKDFVDCSIAEKDITVRYNMNPYEKLDPIRPKFISIVFGYVDKLDLYRYLDCNDTAEFRFRITDSTNSLKKILVEFKYSDNGKILETFEYILVAESAEVRIPLKNMRSEAMKDITEICFVVRPENVSQDKGIFTLSEISIF